MNRFITTLMLLLCTHIATATEVNIIPCPTSVVTQKGSFTISPRTEIYATAETQKCAAIFADQIAREAGGRLKITQHKGNGQIALALDPSLGQEAYRINVSKHGIEVAGGTAQGVFYGLQTLRQIVVVHNGKLPLLRIVDSPKMSYRGMMLDVCRHFFSVDQVKTFIDMMSLHKLNRLHWHLTDDQGWRIEIKKYPRLTEVGSQRKQTLVGRMKKDSTDTYDGTPYGGYYTQEQIREVIAYAAERYIEIIPEIEMPGHAQAALAAYPELGCTGGEYEVWTRWGISDNVYCAGREGTFGFIENVLSEVIALFPSKYLHIGGDECPKSRWKSCPDCQQRIKEEGLKDEVELQGYFVRRIAKWLDSHDRTVIGWDEIYYKGIPKSIVIMPWREQKYGITAAQAGNKVIMTPKWHCYYDYRQTSDPERYEPLCQSRYLSLRQAYRLDPYDCLTPAEQQNIMGVQANLWTEYIPSMGQLQHMVLPRMAAIAEIGWAYDRKNYDDFVRRLSDFAKMYDREGYKYADYVFRGIE